MFDNLYSGQERRGSKSHIFVLAKLVYAKKKNILPRLVGNFCRIYTLNKDLEPSAGKDFNLSCQISS